MGEVKKRTILVVEDEPEMASLLQWRLESAGFNVHLESSGRGALAYAATHQPDLAILDLRLPDVHGYQVCRELRRLYRPWTLPVLMLTAMNQPIDRLRGFAHGSDAYLTKPFESEELLQTIALLLSEETLSADDSALPAV